MSGKSAADLLKELGTYGQKLAQIQPALVKAVAMDLKSAALNDGTLNQKTKLLMALSIAVHTRCEYCIAYYVKSCIDAQASKEEMVEACGVAVQMGGGPAMAFSNLALKMMEELLPQTK